MKAIWGIFCIIIAVFLIYFKVKGKIFKEDPPRNYFYISPEIISFWGGVSTLFLVGVILFVQGILD
ncbi:hypothetical protein [Chryseobacterium koreense]|uniref:hypothetical protein n=1 Tax=Chryseobacterium koreense TaxID=232216 RepID=UPI000AB9911A|nr:hypothetical protein [Chryseobacterium koreense]MBB5334446.1 hypothetical protein [Chryseobacterium koreense]